MENQQVNSLQVELEFYRQNQTTVEQEIRKVIEDNQRLSQQVDALHQEKLQNARREDQDSADELRVQVTLLAKERDSLHVLWQTSQTTIEALETELRTYQSYDKRGHQHADEDIKDLELKLETSLADYLELESQHKELKHKHNSLENELKDKIQEINSYKERGKVLEEQIEELNKTIEELRINLSAEKKNNEELKTQLHLCQKESVDLIKKEAEAKSKVSEALQLFDVVSAQKKEAHKKIAEITVELMQAKQSLCIVKHELETALRSEMDDLKDKYNEKVADMLAHIKNLDSELVEKGILLNNALREVKILQDANEKYIKQHEDCLKEADPKVALAGKKLEAMFQELVASERRNIQLVSEKQCLAIDIQRIQDTHSREVKRREWEESLLRTQCEELKVQVEHLKKSLEDTHDMVDKLQNMLKNRIEVTQKILSTKEEELFELSKHLEKQMELSKNWKESYVEMSEKLKTKLKEMQQENNELRNKLRLPNEESPLEEDSS